jgi:ribose-phosphate pyrophosphokinase
MDVVVTPPAEHLDMDADRLDPHPDDGRREFPDGEAIVRLEDVDSYEEVMLVHAGMPTPDSGLSYLLGALDLLKQHDVRTELFFTYMPFGMQDEAFHDGTLNRARALLDLLEGYYGLEQVHAVDPHFAHRDWVDEYAFEAVHTFPLFDDVIDMDEYVVVGPDLGAVKRFGIEGFTKHRVNSFTVDIGGDAGDLEGKDVVVFDDVIETGGTMVEAYETVKDEGADRVEAAAVHGVLEDGIERVRDTFDGTYLSNSIGGHGFEVAVEPLVREAAGR